ncbi:MAG: hypothetical protein HFJ28_05055 [Clostridia bacterium]|jgi:hypothetical protein|nr:hypothetical protein [Clostridia bacterium]
MKILYLEGTASKDSISLAYGIEGENTDVEGFQKFLRGHHITKIEPGRCIEEIPRSFSKKT